MPANRYATAAEFALFGLPHDATDEVLTAQVEWALDYASAEIDRALSWVVPLPVATWEHLLKGWCCILAQYHVLRVRGFNPDGSDKLVVAEYLRVMEVLKRVSEGQDPLVLDRAQPSRPLQAQVDAPARVYGALRDGKAFSGF